MPGHLDTITSPEEQDLIAALLLADNTVNISSAAAEEGRRRMADPSIKEEEVQSGLA
jgi:hypothetical protein